MAKAKNHAAAVKALVRVKGILRPRDLSERKIPRATLSRLCEAGEITRTGRGLYVAGSENVTEKHTLAEVATLVPHGVVCLLSALQFHELTTQMPGEVWLAIPSKARRPKGNTVSASPSAAAQTAVAAP
jgi:predicted transcriptional regulator of viral defense system